MKFSLIPAFIFAGIASAFAISSDELGSLKLDAVRGKPDAIVRLAECYERGDGVPADKMTALAYCLVAFKKDPKNEALKKRIAALGGERFLPGGGGVLDKPFVADLGLGVKLELLQIPAGTFMMGSPDGEEGRYGNESRVRVRITEPFYLGKTEITQVQWESVMGNNPSHFKGDNLPVERVSWDEAMEFCRKLTERERSAGRLLRDWKYTLPTEAQWEYACRAGTTTAYYTGNSSGDLARAGWYDANSGDKTHPVGQKMPNAWGLYDMHGNVWEWCLDRYGSRLQGGDNPAGPKSGSCRVRRGGGWFFSARLCRSAHRIYASPGDRSFILGFRVALVRE